MNFKDTLVWKTLNDRNMCKVELNCAFCSIKHSWDLYSSFYFIHKSFGYTMVESRFIKVLFVRMYMFLECGGIHLRGLRTKLTSFDYATLCCFSVDQIDMQLDFN